MADEDEELTIVEKQKRIENEIKSLSEDISFITSMPEGSEQKPMLNHMLKKLSRLKLRLKTYYNRN